LDTKASNVSVPEKNKIKYDLSTWHISLREYYSSQRYSLSSETNHFGRTIAAKQTIRMKNPPSILLSALLAGTASILTAGFACAQDDVFVTDNGDNSVSMIAPDGTITQYIDPAKDPGALSGPTGLAFNSAGDLFVANNGNGTIAEFSPGGTFIGDYATGLSNPRGIAFDSAGNLFVAEQNISRITEIPAGTVPGTNFTGSFIVQNLQSPNGIAFDSAGNLYVASGGGGALQKITFSSVGVYDTNFPIVTALTNPNGVASAGGNVFVVNTNANDVLKFAADGTPLGVAIGDSSNTFSNAHGLAIDSAGDFWVTDEGDNSVSEYNAAGGLIETFSGADGAFSGPNFITTMTVPEPSAIALLMASLGLLFYFTRRKAAVATIRS
jgi:sugar lactone lactonase YvrE